MEKKDEYAVIEWENGALSVRSSSTDLEVAHALAVAGLHEIEELVCDEISPLPEVYDPESNGGAKPIVTNGNGSNGHATTFIRNGNSANANANANGNGHVAAPSIAPSPTAGGGATSSLASGPSRALVLVFQTKTEGLHFQASWQVGRTRIPALGQAGQAAGSAHITSAERAKLIGLAAYARKAHFAYNQTTGVYVMESVVEIPNFLKVTLPAWKRLFLVELDDLSANLLKGPRTLEIEAIAQRRRDGQGLDLRWIFKAGERMLTEEEVDLLIKRGTTPVILPTVGIVALPTDRLESLKAWQRSAAETHADGTLSPYLIFSLFNDARLKPCLLILRLENP